jgi:hypothetical protein
MFRPTLQELPPELRDVVQNELRAGEKLVWADRPAPRLFTAATIAPLLFAIPWTAFAVFWTVTAGGFFEDGRHPGPFNGFRYGFALFGVPFILVGLGMLTTPLWTRRAMRRTAYAITDQRAIVFNGGFFGSRTVQSFDPTRLVAMERTERADGSGDLMFEHFTTRRGRGHATTRRGFISVANVKDAEDAIRQTLLPDRVRRIAE